MNGKPGDNPVNDILDHGLPVYSPEIDEMIRQIAKHVPRYRLDDMFDWFAPPSPPEFRQLLQHKLEDLRRDAKDRGWETE